MELCLDQHLTKADGYSIRNPLTSLEDLKVPYVRASNFCLFCVIRSLSVGICRQKQTGAASQGVKTRVEGAGGILWGRSDEKASLPGLACSRRGMESAKALARHSKLDTICIEAGRLRPLFPGLCTNPLPEMHA